MAIPLDKPRPGEPVVQEGEVGLSKNWQQWFDLMLLELHKSLVPPRGIVIIDPAVVDVTTEFPTVAGPTNGLGRVGGPYQWWSLCNGNNGTPNLSSTPIEGTFGMRYIMRTT